MWASLSLLLFVDVIELFINLMNVLHGLFHLTLEISINQAHLQSVTLDVFLAILRDQLLNLFPLSQLLLLVFIRGLMLLLL
jgi:hypothetical protein